LFSFECRFFPEFAAALCFCTEKKSGSNAREVPVLLLLSYEIFTISIVAVKRSE
jgi:hypothetical protein